MERRHMTIRAGESFDILLESNPTTGYSWKPSFDPEDLSLEEHHFEPASSLVGAGGKERFTFNPKREGTIELEMRYMRPWENSPIDIIHLIIEME